MVSNVIVSKEKSNPIPTFKIEYKKLDAREGARYSMLPVTSPGISVPNEHQRLPTVLCWSLILILPELHLLRPLTLENEDWESQHTGCLILPRDNYSSPCEMLPKSGRVITSSPALKKAHALFATPGLNNKSYLFWRNATLEEKRELNIKDT